MGRQRWNGPRGAFRRGDSRVFKAEDWKPSFEPLEEVSISAFAVIVDPVGKKILLVHKKDELPSWGLPGGGVEDGEKPEEGVFREVRDESGYRMYLDGSGRLVGADLVLDYRVTHKHRKLVFFAESGESAERGPVRESDEIDEVRWVTIAEIMAMDPVPFDQAAVDPNRRDYIKSTHRDHILSALSFVGRLEEFGLQEAGPEDPEETASLAE